MFLAILALGFLMPRPPRLSGFGCHLAALLWRHGDHAALPADLAALAPHSGHDAGYIGCGYLGLVLCARRSADHLKCGLVHVPA